ncbi:MULTISPECIES: RrF2 family transcriptional regulator [unclassified Arthrobacter]|uniref:RrF2 family transcriptional regulator n=1 Tax=unclassified Arthrobacter TaxID=235627 RepID=UPI0014930103|nr:MULTISPECIES: Rrf2 family transcriptional regulator [unclassified Arthrobacter]MBE0008275.1 Rrf2 family transcriptional regulator [Arthrobacter sp. AET 35A]NOJ62014.1 Rrf2 family transcriptional regulator [Arthrobacter sp. 147(2020)]
MQVTSRADYALRAVVEIARGEGAVTTRDNLASGQGIPAKFLEAILGELSRSGLLLSKRGAGGGYLLARSAEEISVADVLRAVDGPLAGVRGESPEDVIYPESSETLRQVWIAVRVSLRLVLENTSIQDIVRKELPSSVREMLAIPGAWERR